VGSAFSLKSYMRAQPKLIVNVDIILHQDTNQLPLFFFILTFLLTFGRGGCPKILIDFFLIATLEIYYNLQFCDIA